MTNIKEKLPQKVTAKKKKPNLSWLPEKYKQKYESTDLLYSYCVELFSKLEAAKRDDIPETTMRIWFMEFIRLGWTKAMVAKRYDGLLRKPKYGAIDFSDWVNAVPVYGEDEFLSMVKVRIDQMIHKGKYLIEHKEEITAISEWEREAIEIAIAKEIEFEIMNEKLKRVDEYKEKRREELRSKKKRKA